MQLKVGEVSQGMDDIITFLDNAQPTLDAFDDVKGDPKCLERHMRRLQVGRILKLQQSIYCI